MTKIDDLIKKRQREIESIGKELQSLLEQKTFNDKGFVERDEVVKEKTGRKKADFIEYKIKAGFRTWKEDFVDEDTGQVLTIDRQERVSINGKLVDPFGRAKTVEVRIYYQSSDIPVWKE